MAGTAPPVAADAVPVLVPLCLRVSGGRSVRYGVSPDTLGPCSALCGAGTAARASVAAGACDAVSAAIAAAATAVTLARLPLCSATSRSPLYER